MVSALFLTFKEYPRIRLIMVGGTTNMAWPY